MIPSLETDRLLLRAWKREDFEHHARLMADPDVARYLSGEPQSRADAWRGMATIVGHWTLRGYGYWALERRSDHAFLGRCGLWNPEGWPSVEVGWTLAKEFWGSGYATEAALAALDYAFITQDVDHMISVIDPRNTASQKVAARIGETKGERRELVIGGRTYTADIWSISRSEWERRRKI
jgi:RimJ/RimL family protein N-acetyltransferase